MVTAILQVLGDPKGYKTLRYVIDGSEYRTSLPAFAIKEWLEGRGEDAKVVLLAPDSLITRIEEDREKAVELLSEGLDDRIAELLDVKDVYILPSVGVYSGRYTVRFEGSVENVMVSVFKELVKLGFDKIYADVSTGQNVYTTSMLEALRKYATYRKLECILQGGGGVSIRIAYVPPVLAEGQSVKVELHDFDVRVFFDLPKANPKEICRDVERKIEIQRKYRSFFNELSEDLKVLKMAFHAIKFNAPLVFYHPEMLNLNVDVEDRVNTFLKIIEEIEDSKEISIENGDLVVRRVVLNEANIVNTFFSMALLSSIVNFWKENIREPELDEILETFKNLYENLGLDINSRFLERDIREIRERAEGLSGEKLLLDLYAVGHEPKKSADPKRNFFAHSGFLREITKVIREGDRILLRYESAKDEVIKWLLDPS